MLTVIAFQYPCCLKILEELLKGPRKMSPQVVAISPDIQELITKNFAVYDIKTGELKLIKDMEA